MGLNRVIGLVIGKTVLQLGSVLMLGLVFDELVNDTCCVLLFGLK